MTGQALTMTPAVEGHARTGRPGLSGLSTPALAIRTARTGEAASIHALIHDQLEEGAEVRSLVVRRDVRHQGLGRQLVGELERRARVSGADTLCAFTHDPGYFVRLGFSIVPRHWLREKIVADCQACALFRTCGQCAVVLSLPDRGRRGRLARV